MGAQAAALNDGVGRMWAERRAAERRRRRPSGVCDGRSNGQGTQAATARGERLNTEPVAVERPGRVKKICRGQRESGRRDQRTKWLSESKNGLFVEV